MSKTSHVIPSKAEILQVSQHGKALLLCPLLLLWHLPRCHPGPALYRLTLPLCAITLLLLLALSLTTAQGTS